MTQGSSSSLRFKNAWSFPEPVEDRITSFVDKIGGIWLHAPVGISKLNLGQFKNPNFEMMTLDRDDTLKPDIVCDIFKMSQHIKILDIIKKYGGFDGVISDPLWYFSEQCTHCKETITNRTKGLAYDKRRYLSYEVRQILKPGGKYIFNGLWNPKVKGFHIDKIEIPMQGFSSFRNLSLLVYMTKINEEIPNA